MPLPESVPIESTDMTSKQVRRLVEEIADRSPQGPDRRKHERFPYRQFAVLVLPDQAGEDPSFLVLINNISRGGLAFKHPTPLNPGTACKIKIMLPSGGSVVSEGTVVRCRPIDGNGCEVGLQFEQVLDVNFGRSEEESGLRARFRRAASAVFGR